MKVKFNPTSIHVHRGYLKVRLDVYPDPIDKTYPLHHILVPDVNSAEFVAGYGGEVDDMGTQLNPTDYDRWFRKLPKVWQLNPCLCHFVKIDADITKEKLDSIAQGIFDIATLKQLDDKLAVGDSILLIMASKCG